MGCPVDLESAAHRPVDTHVHAELKGEVLRVEGEVVQLELFVKRALGVDRNREVIALDAHLIVALLDLRLGVGVHVGEYELVKVPRGVWFESRSAVGADGEEGRREIAVDPLCRQVRIIRAAYEEALDEDLGLECAKVLIDCGEPGDLDRFDEQGGGNVWRRRERWGARR